MLRNIAILFILVSGIAFAQFEPKAVISPAEYNFGDIKEGTTAKYSFKIKNDGNDVLIIKNVKASCGCTAVKPAKNELKPGEFTDVAVSFNSDGRSGKQSKTVSVETNDPKNPVQKFSFTCNVVKADGSTSELKAPVINFAETLHDFGKVKEGKVKEYTFKFKNSGNGTLEIKDVRTSCGCTAAMVSSKSIEPGKEGTLKVELDTKDRVPGKMSRNITIISNDPKEPSKILTVSADIVKES